MKQLVYLNEQDDELYVKYKMGEKTILCLNIIPETIFDTLYYLGINLYKSDNLYKKEKLTENEQKTIDIMNTFFVDKTPDFRGVEKFIQRSLLPICIKDYESLDLNEYEYSMLCYYLPNMILNYDKLIDYIRKDIGNNNISIYSLEKIYNRLSPVLTYIELLISSDDALNAFINSVENNVKESNKDENQ